MERENSSLIVFAIILVVVGLSLRVFVGRRRFYRRNQSGVEEFKNYRGTFIITFVERILVIVGCLLMIVGALFVLLAAITAN